MELGKLEIEPSRRFLTALHRSQLHMMFSMASVTAEANVAVKKHTFAQRWLLALSPPAGGEISDPKSLLHYVYCLLVY